MSDSGSKGGLAPLIMGAAVVAGLLFFGLSKRGDDSGNGAAEPDPLQGPAAKSNPSDMREPEPGEGEGGTDNPTEPEGEFIAREDLKVAGYGAPDRAVRSYLAALISSDVDAMADALIPEKAEEFRNLMSVRSLSADIWRGLTNSPVVHRSGVRIVGEDKVSDDEIMLSIRFGSVEEAQTNDVTTVYTLKRIAGD